MWICLCYRTTHEFLFGALAELLDNARSVFYSALLKVSLQCIKDRYKL